MWRNPWNNFLAIYPSSQRAASSMQKKMLIYGRFTHLYCKQQPQYSTRDLSLQPAAYWYQHLATLSQISSLQLFVRQHESHHAAWITDTACDFTMLAERPCPLHSTFHRLSFTYCTVYCHSNLIESMRWHAWSGAGNMSGLQSTCQMALEEP